ncbi:MAG TPA: AlkA N-terminal domain-containing protein [Burkholderiaceae bacterium]|nr:AlkA N-terminal domain-containing protein [Burkholderiaceae bacterium]
MARCQITLPPDYRTADIIAWHVRDPQPVSEKWDNGTLYKGLTWQGRPACLTLHFQDGRAEASLDVGNTNDTAFVSTVRKILGLDQDIDSFEQSVIDHPDLGPLVSRQRGLRVPVAASPYEALIWAIVGQQISVQAAISIRRRFVQTAGRQHAGGLWCHPDAETVADMPATALREAGLSASKVQTILTVSQAIARGDMVLPEHLDTVTAAQLQEQLMSIRGIGVWTADYTLLRGYGWLDGSLHGDAAVRRSLRNILQHDEPVSAEHARTWLQPFSPWRALAAAHLWAALRLQA